MNNRLPNSKTDFWVLFVAAICGLAIILPWFVGNFRLGDPEYTAVVSIDINPSLNYRIDEHGVVISAFAHNEAGVDLLKAVNVKGLTLDQAISLTVAHAHAVGMITSSDPVLITGAINYQCVSVNQAPDVYQQTLIKQLQSIDIPTGELIIWLAKDPTILIDAEKDRLSLGRAVIKLIGSSTDLQFSSDDLHNRPVDLLLEEMAEIDQSKLLTINKK